MRVLIITYHFPPDAEVGAVRPYQFARLLPQHGIEPWILTVQTEFIERPEKQVAIDVPAERIIRTPVGQTRRVRGIRFASHLKNSLRNGLRPHHTQQGLVNATPAPTVQKPATSDINTEGFLRSTPFLRLLLAWLWFPDPMAGWRAPALEAAEKLLAREKFDAIFSTSPPRVVHSIALELARRHNLPWVMDLRDPWYKDVDELNSKLLDRAYERLFLPCLAHANKIVLNTNRLLDDVVHHYPQAAGKSIAIPNGCRVTNEDKNAPEIQEQPKQFSIGHYGSVYSKRDPGPFLRGLKKWLEQKKTAGETVPLQMRFVGPEFGMVPEKLAELGLESVVQLSPPVPREALNALMAEDYILLLLANKQPLQIPGKLYEYLAARRRILASADEAGATSDLLQNAQGTLSVYSEEQVIAALEQFWQEFQSGQAATISNEKLLQECSYASRTARLAEELLALRR